jgi:hypothetical protein
VAAAADAAHYVDMIMAVGTFKHAGYEDFVFGYRYSANRASSFYVSRKAVGTALNMHETVFASRYGRKGMGFYQFAPLELCATDWAGLGLGMVKLDGVLVPLFLTTAQPTQQVRPSFHIVDSCPVPEKNGKSEP